MIENRTILIIEDDFFISDMYRLLFMKKGYDVIVAGDGEEGLSKARSTKVDIILLDIMMPKMNGIDVLKALRNDKSSTKDTPVFLLTNLGQENIIKEAFKIGAQGYLMKANLLPQQVVTQVEDYFAEQAKK
ncbi:MAG TPA: response regulator [Patescibacteria group bacterium]